MPNVSKIFRVSISIKVPPEYGNNTVLLKQKECKFRRHSHNCKIILKYSIFSLCTFSVESNSAKFTQEFIRVDACLKTDTRYIRAWLTIVVELGP